MAYRIKPFRDYDEHEVVNLFAYRGAFPQVAGTMVKLRYGWTAEQELQLYGSAGATYPNTVSPRWGIQACVTACASGNTPYGMLLKDVREVDEKGLPLKFNPSKAFAMGAVTSGQAVPVLKRGLVLYSGIASQSTVGAGTSLYTDAAGGLIADGAAGGKVGIALGPRDAHGFVLVQLEL